MASVGEKTEIRLNPALDRERLRAEFAARGRLQVNNVLTPEAAERMARCMEEETPWSFTYFDRDAACIVDWHKMSSVTPQQWQELNRSIFSLARDDFAYAYGFYPMQEALRTGSDPDLFLHDFFAFLESEEMMELIRDLLDDPSVEAVDAQATRFGPGQFLTWHNDLVKEAHRRCAYVFNFTRRWRPDWGGYLQFWDKGGNGAQAFMPRFNMLNIFKVPQPHSVGCVAPFAGAYRYAVSGWYRANADG